MWKRTSTTRTAGVEWLGRLGSAAVLGYMEEAAEENPDSHMETVTWDSVRSQMADAARKTGQLEASFQEVAKQVEGAGGGLADVLDEINGKIVEVGVWLGEVVNAGKVVKSLTVGFCPSSKVALCTSCKTGYDRAGTGASGVLAS